MYDAAGSETKLPVTVVIKCIFLIHHAIPVKNQLTIQQLFMFIFLVREPDCFRSRTQTVTQHAMTLSMCPTVLSEWEEEEIPSKMFLVIELIM